MSSDDDAQATGHNKEEIGFSIDNTKIEFGVQFNF